jgi:hypothetical protein
MRTLITSISILTLAFGGVAACLDADDDAEIAELEEGVDDEKSDRPDLALTEIEFLAPLKVLETKVGIIKSKAQWVTVFGSAPPASIKWDRDWVAYYTAGAQTSGGYTAEITRVRLSDTGKTLKVSTQLNKPGNDCIVTLALTAPYKIVKFKKPTTSPGANRYFKSTVVYSCAPVCSGTTVSEPVYTPSGSGNEECEGTEEHCLTNDHTACPQLTPLPPNFCPGGTVRTGARRYITSTDGMECSIPSVHCVTNNSNACPQLTPLPPNFCSNGTVKTTPRFIDSSDGMECSIPDVHCVTSGTAACPL